MTGTEYVTWYREPDDPSKNWVTGLLGASRGCPPFIKTMTVHVQRGVAYTATPGTYTYYITITFTDGQTAKCEATIIIT